MARATVDELVEVYLKARPALRRAFQDPAKAAGACCSASLEFAQWVQGLGQKRKVATLLVSERKRRCEETGYCWTVSRSQGDIPPCGTCCTGHYVVEVDGCIVDLTAKQFGLNMPMVYPRKDLEAAWESVEETDRCSSR